MILTSGMASANQFAEQSCQSVLPTDWQCLTVPQGSSWEQLLEEDSYRYLVQRYNRQNKPLRAGQQLVLPPNYLQWKELSPFPEQVTFTEYVEQPIDVIVFSPNQLGWAHYVNNQLVDWGPAVGGKDWCPDVGRACRTQVGTYRFTEAASHTRRSNAYPVGCSGRQCAPMPYFIRFTAYGMGLHERDMEGSNASHGCVGLFREDVVYLNSHVRATVGKNGHGYFTEAQQQQSPLFMVLPYDFVL